MWYKRNEKPVINFQEAGLQLDSFTLLGVVWMLSRIHLTFQSTFKGNKI